MKLKMFEMSKTRNQTAEEYLKVRIPNALSTVRGNFVEAQLTKTQLSLYGLSLFMASSRLFVSLTPSFLFSITAILWIRSSSSVAERLDDHKVCLEWSMSNFPCSLIRKITPHSVRNFAFHSLLRWKMIRGSTLRPTVLLKRSWQLQNCGWTWFEHYLQKCDWLFSPISSPVIILSIPTTPYTHKVGIIWTSKWKGWEHDKVRMICGYVVIEVSFLWIVARILYKESKSVHGQVTSIQ